jgi:hypothetical protein
MERSIHLQCVLFVVLTCGGGICTFPHIICVMNHSTIADMKTPESKEKYRKVAVASKLHIKM